MIIQNYGRQCSATWCKPGRSGEALPPSLIMSFNRYSFFTPVTASRSPLRLCRLRGAAGTSPCTARGVTAAESLLTVSRKKRLAADARKRVGAVTGVGRHRKSMFYGSSLGITQRDDVSKNPLTPKIHIKFFLASWIFNSQYGCLPYLPTDMRNIHAKNHLGDSCFPAMASSSNPFIGDCQQALITLFSHQDYGNSHLMCGIFPFWPVAAKTSSSADCLVNGFLYSFGN